MPDFLKKMINQRQIQTELDDLFFHPCKDEIDKDWLIKHVKEGDMCISCGKCFSVMSFCAV
jgi:hypothetical protein